MSRPQKISDQQIRDTARRLFLAHGPAVTVATIAEELGVSAAAVIQRVGSKGELLRMCLHGDGPPAWIETVERGPGKRPPFDELVDLLVAGAKSMREVVPTLIVWRLGEPNGLLRPDSAVPPPPIQARESLARWLTRATEGGTPIPDPRRVAELLLGAAESRAFLGWVTDLPPHSREEWVEIVRALLPSL
ncbi:MAG: TetR/AcrR family transcriptional regulator [Planctomycetes bacterium]|nr:TetR/AcrR family transcriptional regulator [Planctomycetota bacterium]